MHVQLRTHMPHAGSGGESSYSGICLTFNFNPSHVCETPALTRVQAHTFMFPSFQRTLRTLIPTIILLLTLTITLKQFSTLKCYDLFYENMFSISRGKTGPYNVTINLFIFPQHE